MTPTETAIFEALASGPLTGPELVSSTGRLSGFLYPALLRLERRGLIESEPSDGPPPRFRAYRLVRSPARTLRLRRSAFILKVWELLWLFLLAVLVVTLAKLVIVLLEWLLVP